MWEILGVAFGSEDAHGQLRAVALGFGVLHFAQINMLLPLGLTCQIVITFFLLIIFGLFPILKS